MNDIIKNNIVPIQQLCLQHQVQTLYVIGSVLTDQFNEQSDVDVLVQFGDIAVLDYVDYYFSLQEALEQLFQRPVDLVIEKDIRNPVLRNEFNKTKVKLYECANSKMAA